MSKQDEDPSKRVKYLTPPPEGTPALLPKRYTVSNVTVIDEPNAKDLMFDALSVVSEEILRFRGTSRKRALTIAESRVLQGYIKCLIELQREKREVDDGMDLANLSNEELLKLVEKLKGDKSE